MPQGALPVLDYSQILTTLQKQLGQRFLEDPKLLNVPGSSVACKIDPLYYLALFPSFSRSMAQLAGVLPESVEETLIRTGNLITPSGSDDPTLLLQVSWKTGMQPVKIKAGFVLAGFIDTGLKIYARRQEILPVSDVRIDSRDREQLDAFFAGKTSISSLAFTE
jgi:hypothetical protein